LDRTTDLWEKQGSRTLGGHVNGYIVSLAAEHDVNDNINQCLVIKLCFLPATIILPYT